MNIVKIPTKQYVARFIANMYGTPADLSSNRFVYKYFQSLLDRRVHRFSKRIAFNIDGGNKNNPYRTTVDIVINDDVFMRKGWSLSKDDIVDFNLFVEDYIKEFARLYIAMSITHGIRETQAIRDFQISLGFSEEDWPFDSIKKDFDRNYTKIGSRLGVTNQQLFETSKSTNKSMVQLSKKEGQLSIQF